jgi:hypothetical protein
MTRRSILLLTRVVCLAAIVGGAASGAADAQPVTMQYSPPPTVEIAPFIGWRVGGNIWYDAYGPYPGQLYSDQFDLDPSVSFGLFVDLGGV